MRMPGNSIPPTLPQVPCSHFGGVTSRFRGPNQGLEKNLLIDAIELIAIKPTMPATAQRPPFK